MKATEILKSEHRNIERVLDALGTALARARKSEFDAELFARALEFLVEYADRRHHAKEEERLFPALHRRGVPYEGGPLHCMLEEHQYGRGLLGKVREKLPAARAGDPAAQEAVLGALKSYRAFLRDHIRKEDEILFEIAEEVLTEEDQLALEREFLAFDERGIGERELAAAPR